MLAEQQEEEVKPVEEMKPKPRFNREKTEEDKKH